MATEDEEGNGHPLNGDAAWHFRLAYVVRAVTPGEFAMPAAIVENMYAPAVKARTEMGRVVIGE